MQNKATFYGKKWFPLHPCQQHNDGDFPACGLTGQMEFLMSGIDYKLDPQIPPCCVFSVLWDVGQVEVKTVPAKISITRFKYLFLVELRLLLILNPERCMLLRILSVLCSDSQWS